MFRWMTRNRIRIMSIAGAVVGAGLLGTLGGCNAVQGFGEDISDASIGVREAFVGSDPDAPPLN